MSKILKLITAIRDSNKDAVYLYTNGECYNFALILKTMFEGEIYYSDKVGHVWFKHEDGFYDIEGRCFNPPNDIKPLDHRRPHKPHRWSKEARRQHYLVRAVTHKRHYKIVDNKLVED